MKRYLIYTFSLLLLSYAGLGQKPVVLKLYLADPDPDLSVAVAPLRYNKAFAFSFTFDDGLLSSYWVGLPFFNGGQVAPSFNRPDDQGGDGRLYPGLFFSDGTGNPIPFRAGIAINSGNIVDSDINNKDGYYLSWAQVRNMYHSDWDILNHGYHHQTGQTDFAHEISSNNQEVEKRIGYEMRSFVIPGGAPDHEVISNPGYARAAKTLRMEMISGESLGDFWVDVNDIHDFSHFRMGRLFMRTVGKGLMFRSGNDSAVYGGEANFLRILKDKISEGKPFWINAFTHSVGNANLWNIGIQFNDFKSFFYHLAELYGIDGSDIVWFAGTQRVFDYLKNKEGVELSKISTSRRSRKKVRIDLSVKDVVSDRRYKELTLIVHSKRKLKRVRCTGCTIESYGAANGNGENMINLKW